MSRPCSVCNHPERKAIDAALINGAAYRDVAGQYGPSKSAMQRHADEHLPAALLKAKDAGEIANADNLVEQVRDITRRAGGILDSAEKSGQLDTALRAIREMRGCFELVAKLVGQLDERPVVNVHLSAEWLTIRATIITTLAPYPDARRAVAEALAALEGSGA